MTALPQIQNRLREVYNQLCEACVAEQAWLEEGQVFNPDEAKSDPAGRGGAAATTGEKSISP